VATDLLDLEWFRESLPRTRSRILAAQTTGVVTTTPLPAQASPGSWASPATTSHLSPQRPAQQGKDPWQAYQRIRDAFQAFATNPYETSPEAKISEVMSLATEAVVILRAALLAAEQQRIPEIYNLNPDQLSNNLNEALAMQTQLAEWYHASVNF